jgi:3-oxoacyl-[acyl-carrier protein] reductase
MTNKLDEKIIDGWIKSIPLRRGGKTEDVANSCVFLSSELSTYITGQVLQVDGGMLT